VSFIIRNRPSTTAVTNYHEGILRKMLVLSTRRRQFECVTTSQNVERHGPKNDICGIPDNTLYGEESTPQHQT
jgi:hypothetical protein